MYRSAKSLIIALMIIALSLPISVSAHKSKKEAKAKESKAVTRPVLWHEPGNLAARDLFYGPGGKAHQPKRGFKFIKEDKGGSNPKFIVQDGQGVKWKVKLGTEAQPETAATRLVWAAGYFADEDYYFPELRVDGMKKLSRGREFVSPGGVVRGARLEREKKGEKKLGNWSWFENPFVGTKELDGLKIMMVLINNWDLKEENNDVYLTRGERRYVISDLGASFGKTGSSLSRSRGDLEDYLESKFIKEVTPTKVDFVLHSRPPFILAVDVPYYRERARIEKIVKDIPRAHARWIGRQLAGLSHKQIGDAFRAAGYAPSEVEAYTRKVRERIDALNKL